MTPRFAFPTQAMAADNQRNVGVVSEQFLNGQIVLIFVQTDVERFRH